LPDNRGFFVFLPGAWNFMNTTYKRLRTRFAPETVFEVKPLPAATFRVAQEARFEALKHRLLLNSLDELPDARVNARLRRAANEAAALAWLTPYPVLVYPLLFEEKARTAALYARRQRQVKTRTAQFLAA
jgi:hypothetical protein